MSTLNAVLASTIIKELIAPPVTNYAISKVGGTGSYVKLIPSQYRIAELELEQGPTFADHRRVSPPQSEYSL